MTMGFSEEVRNWFSGFSAGGDWVLEIIIKFSVTGEDTDWFVEMISTVRFDFAPFCQGF